MDNKLVLGIDTSNYTTSVALVSPYETIKDCRTMLRVPKDQCGLRQSDAFFQHIQNLPKLIEEVTTNYSSQIGCISAADRPRPVEGSYMPVFTAGTSVAQSIASAMGIPFFTFSHQEGHMAAFSNEGIYQNARWFHMSGGTCELVELINGQIEIIGGTKDISFGQVLDRVGVKMGIPFPAGGQLDLMASENKPSNILTRIKVKEGYCNLSGIETQCQRFLRDQVDNGPLASEIFQKIADAILDITMGKTTVLIGGVSSSQTLRQILAKEEHLIFPPAEMGKDNAVGIARLGGLKIWP